MIPWESITTICAVIFGAGIAGARKPERFMGYFPVELILPVTKLLNYFNRKAFPTTEAELRLIAKAAISGDKSNPVMGYNKPAAIGTPKAL